jgi:hypothetical protein
MVSQQVKVTIVEAQSVLDAQSLLHASGTYCVCQIHDKDLNQSMCFRTKAISNTASPVWDHVHLWTGSEGRDKITFKVFTTGPSKNDEVLGMAELDISQVALRPFEGQLQLLNGGNSTTATLTVKVAVPDVPIPYSIDIEETSNGRMPLHDLMYRQGVGLDSAESTQKKEYEAKELGTVLPPATVRHAARLGSIASPQEGSPTSAAGFAAPASPSPVNADVLAPAANKALARPISQNAGSTVLLGRIGLDAAIGESGDIGKGHWQRNGKRRPFTPACMEAIATHCLPGWIEVRRMPARPSPAQ